MGYIYLVTTLILVATPILVTPILITQLLSQITNILEIRKILDGVTSRVLIGQGTEYFLGK